MVEMRSEAEAEALDGETTGLLPQADASMASEREQGYAAILRDSEMDKMTVEEKEAKKRGVGSFAKSNDFKAPAWMNKFKGGFVAHDIDTLEVNRIRGGFKLRPMHLRLFK